ncbi:MAG: hypothetical protein EZS28_007516, partial [Streblomastix strix]
RKREKAVARADLL